MWMSSIPELLNVATHLLSEQERERKRFFYYFPYLPKILQTPPFARMHLNQACNYNLEHAVKLNSSRQFERKQCTLFPAHREAQLRSKSFGLYLSSSFSIFLFFSLKSNFFLAIPNTHAHWKKSQIPIISPFPPQVCEMFSWLWWCYFKSLGLESECEED